MMVIIGQEEGAKSIEQISKELHEYLWLTPFEIKNLLFLAAQINVNRYKDQINTALEGQVFKKGISEKAQQKFSNPFIMSVRYP